MLWARFFIRALALVAAMTVAFACSSANDIAAAKRGVAHFHQLMAEGNFSTIYLESDPAIRQTSEEEFVRSLWTIKSELGAAGKSELVGSNWRSGHVVFSDATFSGTFVILSYRTRFSARSATEVFTWRVENGHVALTGWEVEAE